MVLGPVYMLGEMAWDATYQSGLAVACIGTAIGTAVFGTSSKPPTIESPRIKYKPQKLSPHAAAPTLPLGAGAVPLEKLEKQEQEGVGRPSSAASFHSLPHQPQSARSSAAASSPATFDRKVEDKSISPEPTEGTGSERERRQAMAAAEEAREEAFHLHHPPLHLPTYQGEAAAGGGGEEGMAAMGMGGGQGGSMGGRPRSWHRSSSTKQVKCSVM